MTMKYKFVVYVLFAFAISQSSIAQTIKTKLNNNWQFAQKGTNKWYKANVPGTVHTDLLANKLIEDPFYRDNEIKLQWISATDWQYKTVFNVDDSFFQKEHVELVFEGLDTYASVFLNNQQILLANNMFRTWRVDVKKVLKKTNNQLLIVFRNADAVADSLAKVSDLIHPCENNRNYVRKAQYHFGWDFAPKLTTCGIWRNIQLEAYHQPKIEKEKLPNNHVKLVQENDSIGQSFYFTVNNKPTFIKGANWVSADVFLPRVTKEKYRKLLVAAKQANINMLRVWGGGVYEDDAFYDLCDSLGIMVWQDFMFAGAMYPASKNDIENIKAEVIDNIKRLQKHSCIVVWCGNNEIDEAWHNWGWQKQFHLSANDSAELWNEYKTIFHELLPQLVKEYDSTRQYITTSPQNGWGRKESLTNGDCHFWGVWWGLQPIETYQQKIPRFMSEYGMQSFPNFSSIQKFTASSDWDTSSVVMKLHQKHATGYENLKSYLHQNKLNPENFKALIQATQQIQSKALLIAINAHISHQPYCMGTMLWQLNDCYPGITWSLIDYYGERKKSYFVVKEAYR